MVLRKWKTPVCLRTPKPADVSFMSVEDYDEEEAERNDDATTVRIKLEEGTTRPTPTEESDVSDERKRRNNSPGSGWLGRKRMRLAHATSVRKPTATKAAYVTAVSSAATAGQKLDFGKDVQEQEQQQHKLLEARLDLLEQQALDHTTLTAEKMKQMESELVWMMKQQATLVNDERFSRLLARLTNRLRDVELAEQSKQAGTMLYRAGKYVEADAAYTEAIRLDPARPCHFSNRAATLIMLGRFQAAIAECDRALGLDPAFVRAHLRSARASLCLGDTFSTYDKLNRISNSVDDEFRDEATELANQVKLYSVCIEQADLYLASEDGKTALRKAREALGIAPGSVRAQVLQVTAQVVIQLRSDSNVDVNPALGEIERLGNAACLDVHRYGMVLWQRAFVAEAAAFLGLAQRLAQGGRGLDSKSFERVRDVDEFLRRAKRSRKENKLGEAVFFCDQAAVLAMTHDLLWTKITVLRAHTNMLAGKFAEAERDCTKALKRAPHYFASRIVLASALAALNKLVEAERELVFVETNFAGVLRSSHREEIRTVREALKAKVDASRPSKKTQNDENDVSGFLNLKQKQNHYSVLGVDKRASKEEIRKAYKQKALRFHPDKNSDPRAAEVFKRIVEAATVISSPSKRRMYDVTLM